MIRLTDLTYRLEGAGLLTGRSGRFDIQCIDHLAYDSRAVGADGLFVAIRGAQADGHLFIEKAVQNGAIAVVCEAMPAEAQTRFPGIAFAQVTNTRAALAEMAATFYGEPARQLHMIGVTGTNGKTTTAFLIHHLFEAMGWKTGLISTVAYRFGDRQEPATHTTPDVLDTMRMLREMADAGCTACVMEVSSHALAQERVRTIPFAAAIFTNFTRDHLDYHGSMAAYLAAKKRLFDELAPDAAAIYNIDDPAGPQMVADCRGRIVSYGCGEAADVRGVVLENTIEGLRLAIDGFVRRFRLVGRFNAYNLMAAYAAGRARGWEADRILDALAGAPPVPGRFERIAVSRRRHVIVDYAHTPDALENVLRTLRETKPEASSVWCVFGCGGDRDATKRPIMGRIAEQWADRVIVTSDNPRTEDPLAIMENIREGFHDPERAHWIADRRQAIRHAAERSDPGDIVLIAGKGHEPYQVIGTTKRPFDDRDEARAAFGPPDTME